MKEKEVERKKFTKLIKVEGREYYEAHLRILNMFLPDRLTDTEITILACFMNIENPLAKEDRFNSVFRKQVYKELSTNASSTSFHLTSIKKKRVLEEDAIGRLKVRESLWPDRDFSRYEFVVQKVQPQEIKEEEVVSN